MLSENSATHYNGDRIDNVPVITQLNIADLAPGKIHRLMFKGASQNIGHNWYVPVLVAKGRQDGPRLLLNSGIHGDELNGSRVIHKLFAELDPEQLQGSIIGVPQACPNSLLHINRNWYLSTDGGDYVNMNRLFPGKANGNSAEQHAYLLWNQLWVHNSDFVIDLHSQSTDTSYPLFVFADFRQPQVRRMAELIPADQIKDDSGESGTVETTFIEYGIPALTLEIGSPRAYQHDYIERTLRGIHNILIDQQMLAGTISDTAHSRNSFIGNNMHSICASCGGYAELMVALGELVELNQLVAIQRNPFGDIIQEYRTPVSGKVLSLGTGATREAGGLLVRILYFS